MAVYSISTTAQDDKAITQGRKRYNKAKTKEGLAASPPTTWVDINDTTWIQTIALPSLLANLKREGDVEDAQDVRDAFLTANNATQNSVKSTLGIP